MIFSFWSQENTALTSSCSCQHYRVLIAEPSEKPPQGVEWVKDLRRDEEEIDRVEGLLRRWPNIKLKCGLSEQLDDYRADM